MALSLTHLYVDTSGGQADTGTGTIGDPYKDLEYCMEQEDWVAGGIQVNVNSAAPNIVAADLDTAMADVSAPGKTVAWVPTETGPLVIRGYTSVANDRGVGDLDGNAASSILVTTLDYITFKDMHLHNTGANQIFYGDNYSGCVNCEIDTSTHANPLRLDTSAMLVDCYVHDLTSATSAVTFANGASFVVGNTVVTDGAGDGIVVINSSCIINNIVICNNIVGGGIVINGDGVYCNHNSVYSSVANTGIGIEIQTDRLLCSLTNNVVEGFSGVGGIGIAGTNDAAVGTQLYGGNGFYNCTLGTGTGLNVYDDLGDNETFTVSPFTDAALNDFSGIDTGNMKEGALPQTIGNGAV